MTIEKETSKTPFLKSFWPAILVAAVILSLSTFGKVNLPQSLHDLFSVDKAGHTFFYGLLTFLVLKGFWEQGKKAELISVLTCISYGVLIEIVQYTLFPGRFFEFLDIIANIIGSIIGLYIFKYFINKKTGSYEF